MASPDGRVGVGRAPGVTVLLPVRNGAATLLQAAASILAQSLQDFELLAVDDGSDDDTPALLARLAQADQRVRVIRQPALGLVAALNRGMAEARAPLVARMDADDVAAPERLARQAAELAANPQVALMGSAWRVVSATGLVRRVVRPPEGDAALRAAMLVSNALAHPTVMLRREAVLQAGGYRPAFLLAEDYDLWLRLLGRHELACLPDVLLDYREHAGQSAWRGLKQRMLSEMGALAAHRRRLAGQDDLGHGEAPIDSARLREMGMTDQEIGAGLIARSVGAAKDARSAGQRRAMRQAARLGLAQPALRSRTRVHLAMLWAQSLVV